MATRIYKTPFAATGDKETLATADQPDGKVSLQAGWTPDYELPNDSANYRPVGRAEMNGVISELTEGIGEVQLNGFAKWQAIDGGWPLGAIVKHGGATYSSLIDNNGDEPSIVSSTWVQVLTNEATTTLAGIIRLATTAQAQAWTDDSTALTPKKLADAFKGSNQSFATDGYQKLPGGLIIQWGTANVFSSGPTTITFPIAFPNVPLAIAAIGAGASFIVGNGFVGKTGVSLYSSPNNAQATYIAIGY